VGKARKSRQNSGFVRVRVQKRVRFSGSRHQFLAQHVPRREKFRPNPAGLVRSVSGSRDVSDVNAQASQLPREPAEREEQSALNERLESPVQIRGLYANINVHGFLAPYSLSPLL
jgi:hypothetical protein